ncbi:MAG TPA: phosphoribosylglycinamide formyltransferase [Pseudoxanthomonas sp.]|jgi:phosphoribosylglycinamide formyltransferase-1|nr:phosphoribosylglycinamide formyltransferase [Pseudoxanthomonas sp.]
MDAIARACETERWPARIAAVISNRAEAGGLATAAARGIPVAVLSHRDHATREAFDAALADLIDGYAPDLVVLAGFMRILTPGFVQRYAGRMINIHPSLLPGFPGLHTHARALEAGVKVHGASVHFVTPELDHGPIVIQGALDVLQSDTEQSLASRVLALEHLIYPRAVRWAIEDRLQVAAGVVRVIPPEPQLLVMAGEGAA